MASNPRRFSRLDRAKRARVLIVEDDHVNAAVAEGYLAELGCSSEWVAEGRGALARSAVERFDLILMDLNMPGLDGYGTTALIRQNDHTSRVPIVALTANDASAYREACVRAGMDDILSKPYTLEEFARLLDRWVPSCRRTPLQRRDARIFPGRWLSWTKASLRACVACHPADAMICWADWWDSSPTRVPGPCNILQGFLNAGGLAEAAAVCHKMKSAAANVGALNFSRGITELEQACRTSDLTRALELSVRSAAPFRRSSQR